MLARLRSAADALTHGFGAAFTGCGCPTTGQPRAAAPSPRHHHTQHTRAAAFAARRRNATPRRDAYPPRRPPREESKDDDVVARNPIEARLLARERERKAKKPLTAKDLDNKMAEAEERRQLELEAIKFKGAQFRGPRRARRTVDYGEEKDSLARRAARRPRRRRFNLLLLADARSPRRFEPPPATAIAHRWNASTLLPQNDTRRSPVAIAASELARRRRHWRRCRRRRLNGPWQPAVDGGGGRSSRRLASSPAVWVEGHTESADERDGASRLAGSPPAVAPWPLARSKTYFYCETAAIWLRWRDFVKPRRRGAAIVHLSSYFICQCCGLGN